MNTYLVKIITTSALLFLSTQLNASTIYRWIDDNGKQHFSDRSSNSKNSIEFKGSPLASISLVKTETIKNANRPKRKNTKKNSVKSKPRYCKQLKTKIASLENKLKQHLKAEKSDLYSLELSNLKWLKIKSC